MNLGLYPEYPILIVDDYEPFVDIFKVTLKSIGITNVECCPDSRQVMQKLKNKKYALVFLDIIMPFIRGDDLLKQIVDSYRKIPVVMLTAVNEFNIADNCIKIGAKAYLVKPVNDSDIRNKILPLLDNSQDSLEVIPISNRLSSILLLLLIVLKLYPKAVENPVDRRRSFGEMQKQCKRLIKCG